MYPLSILPLLLKLAQTSPEVTEMLARLRRSRTISLIAEITMTVNRLKSLRDERRAFARKIRTAKRAAVESGMAQELSLTEADLEVADLLLDLYRLGRRLQ